MGEIPMRIQTAPLIDFSLHLPLPQSFAVPVGLTNTYK